MIELLSSSDRANLRRAINGETKLTLSELPSQEISKIIEGLTHLRQLIISNSSVKDLRFLENLTSLEILVLYSSNITSIASISNLQTLKELNLSDNSIDDFQPICNLIELRRLDISNNPVQRLDFLENLYNLEELFMSEIQSISMLSIEHLKKLKYLDLSYSNLSDFDQLSQLLSLSDIIVDIYDCGFKSFSVDWYKKVMSDRRAMIMQIKRLKNKAVKNQYYEKAADLRDVESKLIREYSLGNEKINNQEYLSQKDFFDQIFLEYVSSNPIESPPLEIIKRGKDNIVKYFEDLIEFGSSKLYEAKLLIIGEGESGKTTLARKLIDENAPMPEKETERTEGIDVISMKISNLNSNEDDFQMHIWDFGGQEIYHATHQFFLTQRSLYVIVNNTRSNLTDFNEWIQKVSVLANNSPVIIVQNQVANSSVDIDLRGLQTQFNNVLQVYDVDLSNVYDGRFTKLKKALEFNIQQLEHIGNELPYQWVSIRKEIEDLEKNNPYISDKHYYSICEKHGINDDKQVSRLSSYFHDLGIFLHFQDEMILKRIVILQNAWATKGVYMILDSAEIQQRKGVFTYDQIQKLFIETPFEEMHDEILSLMGKFELCYRLPNLKEPYFVAPQMLSKEKPELDWDEKNNLILYYKYDFMPKGIVSRLMVRLYRFIKDVESLAWRNGCVFNFEETDALVTETYGTKKIEIRIKGENKVKLSAIVSSELDYLNSSFDNLKFDKLIPCNCSLCIGSLSPHYFKYDDLMRRKSRGKKKTIECVKSEEDVDYLVLLEGVLGDYRNDDFERRMNIKNIRNAIGKNDIKAALSYLQKIDEDAYIIISGRYSLIEEENYLGLSGSETYYRELTKIGYDIMRTIAQ